MRVYGYKDIETGITNKCPAVTYGLSVYRQVTKRVKIQIQFSLRGINMIFHEYQYTKSFHRNCSIGRLSYVFELAYRLVKVVFDSSIVIRLA